MGDEAERVADEYIDEEIDSVLKNSNSSELPHTIDYVNSAQKSKGVKAKCPRCGKTFVKKVPHQKFCRIKCKDRYWNKLKPNRHF